MKIGLSRKIYDRSEQIRSEAYKRTGTASKTGSYALQKKRQPSVCGWLALRYIPGGEAVQYSFDRSVEMRGSS